MPGYIPPEADVASFFHHAPPAQGRFCLGLACFVARRFAPDRWAKACAGIPREYCFGRCYAGPSSNLDPAMPEVVVDAREPVLFCELEPYAGLARARDMSAEALVSLVESSTLRGRGGAGFSTGRKLRAVLERHSGLKYIVANADEGDPGAFSDRVLMLRRPHRLIEGMAIAARATGATQGLIYVREEYPHTFAVLEAALLEARRLGALGDGFDIRLVSGRGSYVCGEETAMLNAIERVRPAVRVRPPYPTECGLYGRPTLVNNVETLAVLPWIVGRGADAYRRLGFSASRGTKLMSLNSLFNRPGLYEVEFGLPLRRLCEELGGGLRSGPMCGVIIGGPLAGVVPPSLLDTPVGFEELRAIGASLGHGGVVAFDAGTSVRELLEHVLGFAAYESCGQCAPCRYGGARLEWLLKGGRLTREDWDDTVSALAHNSLCGLGGGLADFALSLTRHYEKEMSPCFT